ncbi:MAG: outer membrane protein transport protein [Candidatus Aminicenantes bacterium]|nr:MAG: outer membrane protein transport protein [Candidatus Aminicenantes bacterium]
MKKSIGVIALAALIIFALSPSAHGAGFLIYEHGAAAMAMAGAFVGLANDATAVFHNPAGIAFLEGTQVSAGVTLIFPSSTLTMPDIGLVNPAYGETYDQVSQVFYPPTFYITHKFTDNLVAGFGFFAPYGLGTEWPDPATFPLRYISTRANMQTLIFNPTLAYKFNDNLSVGVGVSYIHSSLELDLTYLLDLTAIPPLGIYDIPVTVEETTGTAWAVNAGFLYKGDMFSLGFNWRGGFTIDYDGNLDLDMSPVPIPLPENGTVVAPFSFPHILGIGTAFNLSDQLILTADVHYILWSAFDRIEVEADVPGLPIALDFEPIDENFEDSFVFRVGMQYQMNENFALRGGFLYDQTPQPVESMDTMLPDSNRWALTAGFGYSVGKFAIDVAYQFEPFKDRISPNRDIYDTPLGNFGEGTYSSTAHLFGISFRYVF